jgi:hypothetical protein
MSQIILQIQSHLIFEMTTDSEAINNHANPQRNGVAKCFWCTGMSRELLLPHLKKDMKDVKMRSGLSKSSGLRKVLQQKFSIMPVKKKSAFTVAKRKQGIDGHFRKTLLDWLFERYLDRSEKS